MKAYDKNLSKAPLDVIYVLAKPNFYQSSLVSLTTLYTFPVLQLVTY